MPEATAFAPGHWSWAELASPDPELSKRFYRTLFGWGSYTLTVGDLGDYEIFTLDGVQGPEVAGMQALADDSETASWTCYFRTDDIPATLAAVRAAGGMETVEPTDIANLGRMALCTDPEGADFALWYPYHLKGAGVIDEPSAMVWVELAARDTERARRFYGEVFGWKAVARHYHGSVYTHWKAGDLAVAGLIFMDETWPSGDPSHWTPFVWVADCDASADLAVELGAQVRTPPTQREPGRYSVVIDPTGARLGLFTPSVDLHAERTRP
ncbi:VOC family protein [Actinomadura mexicana]|uniref:VOC domain-containing protein n=1 Tax=Actinomadura mexicana TaxID=134959 RepID=A0A239BFF9_9ACTN|nr:VOC family protein [Actinomadura mexicana]SNS06231.1 hypothetical protein SAMN06265355_110155 [Actinomadura mexicana]